MLRWALRYLMVATAVAALFAMLWDHDWSRPAARQVSGERTHQRAPSRQIEDDESDSADLEEDESDAGDPEYDEDDTGDLEYDDSDTDDPEQDEDDTGDLEQIIDVGPQGHFMIDGLVNGKPVAFMVDTGASHVVLTLEDARKLGFSASNLDFAYQFASANGIVRAALVELREIRIGQFQLYDLEAFVNGGPLPISLLGMSFLERLRSYEVSSGRLVLRW